MIMPELPSEELLAALERAALLARWLEALKGEPLQPALRAEDRLDGLGALAKEHAAAINQLLGSGGRTLVPNFKVRVAIACSGSAADRAAK